MKQQTRQRNKKKFGRTTLHRSKDTTVKIKPKQQEPCRTLNPKPKISMPAVDTKRRKVYARRQTANALHG
jgi:hypothetical protein